MKGALTKRVDVNLNDRQRLLLQALLCALLPVFALICVVIYLVRRRSLRGVLPRTRKSSISSTSISKTSISGPLHLPRYSTENDIEIVYQGVGRDGEPVEVRLRGEDARTEKASGGLLGTEEAAGGSGTVWEDQQEDEEEALYPTMSPSTASATRRRRSSSFSLSLSHYSATRSTRPPSSRSRSLSSGSWFDIATYSQVAPDPSPLTEFKRVRFNAIPEEPNGGGSRKRQSVLGRISPLKSALLKAPKFPTMTTATLGPDSTMGSGPPRTRIDGRPSMPSRLSLQLEPFSLSFSRTRPPSPSPDSFEDRRMEALTEALVLPSSSVNPISPARPRRSSKRTTEPQPRPRSMPFFEELRRASGTGTGSVWSFPFTSEDLPSTSSPLAVASRRMDASGSKATEKMSMEVKSEFSERPSGEKTSTGSASIYEPTPKRATTPEIKAESMPWTPPITPPKPLLSTQTSTQTFHTTATSTPPPLPKTPAAFATPPPNPAPYTLLSTPISNRSKGKERKISVDSDFFDPAYYSIIPLTSPRPVRAEFARADSVDSLDVLNGRRDDARVLEFFERDPKAIDGRAIGMRRESDGSSLEEAVAIARKRSRLELRERTPSETEELKDAPKPLLNTPPSTPRDRIRAISAANSISSLPSTPPSPAVSVPSKIYNRRHPPSPLSISPLPPRLARSIIQTPSPVHTPLSNRLSLRFATGDSGSDSSSSGSRASLDSILGEYENVVGEEGRVKAKRLRRSLDLHPKLVCYEVALRCHQPVLQGRRLRFLSVREPAQDVPGLLERPCTESGKATRWTKRDS